jgi:hypothetical protein
LRKRPLDEVVGRAAVGRGIQDAHPVTIATALQATYSDLVSLGPGLRKGSRVRGRAP